MADNTTDFARALGSLSRAARNLAAQGVMGRACHMPTDELREYIATCTPAVRGTAYHAAKRIIDAIEREPREPDEFLKLAR